MNLSPPLSSSTIVPILFPESEVGKGRSMSVPPAALEQKGLQHAHVRLSFLQNITRYDYGGILVTPIYYQDQNLTLTDRYSPLTPLDYTSPSPSLSSLSHQHTVDLRKTETVARTCHDCPASRAGMK
jgi:hypothetical protein